MSSRASGPELYTLLAACCERMVRNVLGKPKRAWEELVGAQAKGVLRNALTAYAVSDEPTPSTTPVRIRFS